jgi:hypothetical protein
MIIRHVLSFLCDIRILGVKIEAREIQHYGTKSNRCQNVGKCFFYQSSSYYHVTQWRMTDAYRLGRRKLSVIWNFLMHSDFTHNVSHMVSAFSISCLHG